MHFPDRRLRKDSQNSQSADTKALRQAFKYEVRPADYFRRVWLTALVSAIYFAYASTLKSGNFDLSLLIPPGPCWHSHDHLGGLYMETWSTILVNGLQVGFALWGTVLLFLGFFRSFTSNKFVFACFYLGLAFLGFVLVLPGWTQTLLSMLIEKCPVLVQ